MAAMEPHWFRELQNREWARMIPSLIAAERIGRNRSLSEPGTREELFWFLRQVINTTPADFAVRLHRCGTGQPVMTEIDLKGDGIYGEVVGHGFYQEETKRQTLIVDEGLTTAPTVDALTDFLWKELEHPLSNCLFDY